MKRRPVVVLAALLLAGLLPVVLNPMATQAQTTTKSRLRDR